MNDILKIYELITFNDEKYAIIFAIIIFIIIIITTIFLVKKELKNDWFNSILYD